LLSTAVTVNNYKSQHGMACIPPHLLQGSIADSRVMISVVTVAVAVVAASVTAANGVTVLVAPAAAVTASVTVPSAAVSVVTAVISRNRKHLLQTHGDPSL